MTHDPHPSRPPRPHRSAPPPLLASDATEPDSPLDYRSPLPGEAPRRRFSPRTFAGTFGVMFILLAILTVVMPRVEVVYKDFGVKLPTITRVVLASGRPISGIPAWVFAIPLALGAAFVAATLPFGGRALRVVLVLLFAATVLCVALALFLPMITLMDGLTTGKP